MGSFGVKITKNALFCAKNRKKWRISAGLRAVFVVKTLSALLSRCVL